MGVRGEKMEVHAPLLPLVSITASDFIGQFIITCRLIMTLLSHAHTHTHTCYTHTHTDTRHTHTLSPDREVSVSAPDV